MSHTGVFTSDASESNLDDGKDWLLLKADVAEPEESKAAATSFLIDVKKFSQNQTIKVDGAESSLGTVPTILMKDASAVAVHSAIVGAGPEQSGKKKRPAKKAAKSGSKKAAKKKAAKATNKTSVKKSSKLKKRKTASKGTRKSPKRT